MTIELLIAARATHHYVLVPKLRLGTHSWKLRFPIRAPREAGLVKQSFRECVPKRSLGTRSVFSHFSKGALSTQQSVRHRARPGS